MAKRGYTHITVVLDKSGSMGSCKDDTIGGFNEFSKSQKDLDGNATLSMFQFNSQIDHTYDFEDLKEISDM